MYSIPEYQRLAMITANRSLSKRDWQCNAYTGLVGEVAELFELLYANSQPQPQVSTLLAKELGDVAWYIAAMCDAFNLDIAKVLNADSWDSCFGSRTPTPSTQHAMLVVSAGTMVDYLKKVFFHGHSLNTEKLESMLGCVASYWADLCVIHTSQPFEAVVNANIEKLKARYPEGFSTTASLTRKD